MFLQGLDRVVQGCNKIIEPITVRTAVILAVRVHILQGIQRIFQNQSSVLA